MSTRRGSLKEAQALHSKKSQMLPKYRSCCGANCSRKTHKLLGIPVCYPGYTRRHRRPGYLWTDALCPWEACPYHLAALSSTCTGGECSPCQGLPLRACLPLAATSWGLGGAVFQALVSWSPGQGSEHQSHSSPCCIIRGLSYRKESFLDPFVGQKWEIRWCVRQEGPLGVQLLISYCGKTTGPQTWL